MSLREDLRQQDPIRESLAHFSKEELADMMSHLVKTYVIDGVAPQKPDVGKVHVPRHLRELSFAALIEALKFHLDLPELEKLNVVNGEVFVKLGEREYSLEGRGPTSAPSAPQPAAAAPAPPRPTTGPAAAVPALEPPRTAPARPREDAANEVSDRFRMLELD